MGGIKGSGFLGMLYSILGLVLLSALFIPIMAALASLYSTTGASTFIAFQVVVTIAPTVLLLYFVFRVGQAYWSSSQKLSSNDPTGMLRIVIGALQIILFVTMFATVVTYFYTLYTTYGANTTWIAFGTVLTIVPTILFIGGIFSGGMTLEKGARARFGGGKSGKKEAAA